MAHVVTLYFWYIIKRSAKDKKVIYYHLFHRAAFHRRLLCFTDYMKRYYFPHRTIKDLFLYIDALQCSSGWAFYDNKRGYRVYASEWHAKKYG